MAKTATRGVKDTWKSKKWYQVHAPPSFNSVLLGETPAGDPADLPGRTIEVSLAELMGDVKDMKKQKIRLRFRITEVNGTDAKTELIGHSIARDYERSINRRGKSMVKYRMVTKTQDGKTLVVKTLGTIGKRIGANRKTAMRSAVVKLLESSAGERSADEFYQYMLYGKLGAMLHRAANKVYPVKFITIRKTELKT